MQPPIYLIYGVLQQLFRFFGQKKAPLIESGAREKNPVSEVKYHVATECQAVIVGELIVDSFHELVAVKIGHLDVGIVPSDFRPDGEEPGRAPVQTE
jgi:hypothetical protein